MKCMNTDALSRTSARSAQLIAASERNTLDPFTEIDWELPMGDRDYYLPQQWLPLFGTPQWEAMDETQRMIYSRHECASLFSAGIWFETQLMQLVLRHLLEIPVTSPAHRYLLIEVADECRHSSMFGEFIRRADTPTYVPTVDADLEALRHVPGGRALGYLLILAMEEILDAVNRSTMRDESVHPVSRAIAKIHVLEEARHVSFAKTYLAEVWPSLEAEERDAVRSLAPPTVAKVVSLLINPDLFEALGIEGGLIAAQMNPMYRMQSIVGLAKLTAFLTELCVIDADNVHVWAGYGLVDNV